MSDASTNQRSPLFNQSTISTTQPISVSRLYAYRINHSARATLLNQLAPFSLQQINVGLFNVQRPSSINTTTFVLLSHSSLSVDEC